MVSSRPIGHLARSLVGSISIRVSKDRSQDRSRRNDVQLRQPTAASDEPGNSLPRRVIMLRSNLHGKLRQRRKNDFLLAWASDRNFSVGTTEVFRSFEKPCVTPLPTKNSYFAQIRIYSLFFSSPLSSTFSRHNHFNIIVHIYTNSFRIVLLNTRY